MACVAALDKKRANVFLEKINPVSLSPTGQDCQPKERDSDTNTHVNYCVTRMVFVARACHEKIREGTDSLTVAVR